MLFNFGSLALPQRRHHTTSKVERVNGVVAEVLSSLPATGKTTGKTWWQLMPLVGFAINYSASSLESGCTPIAPQPPLIGVIAPTAAQHPRRPLRRPARRL